MVQGTREDDTSGGIRLIRAGDPDASGALQAWLAHGVAELTHAPTGVRTGGMEILELAAGAGSGLHHHGGEETLLAVIAGQLRVDWGDEPRSVTAGPGDLVVVAAWVRHAESAVGGHSVRYAFYAEGAGTIPA